MVPARSVSAVEIKARATACGFDLCGIAPAADVKELEFLREWIARGNHGEMHYMARTADRRADVRAVLPAARSVIVLGTVYNTRQPYSTDVGDPSRAAIARYEMLGHDAGATTARTNLARLQAIWAGYLGEDDERRF